MIVFTFEKEKNRENKHQIEQKDGRSDCTRKKEIGIS